MFKEINYLIIAIIISLFFAGGCASEKNEKESGLLISNVCDTTYLSEFRNLSACQKVDYIEKKYATINPSCIEIMSRDLSKLTSTRSSMKGTFFGINYTSDSLFQEDVRRWRNILNCK